MDILLSEHLRGFFLAVGVGVLLGALYDVFRIFRILFRPPKAHVFFADIAYCIICAFITFLTALAACKGDLRFYVFAGEGIGWCIYYLTVGMVTAHIFRWIFKVVNHFFWIPLKRFFRWFAGKIEGSLRWFWTLMKKILQKLKKSLKPHCRMVYNQNNIEQKNTGKRSKKRNGRVKQKSETHQEKKEASF